MNLLIAPFVNAIFGFYYLLGNLGWSIIVVTVIIRIVLLPLVIPSLKSADKMRLLQPKLKKIQEKYGKDKEGLAKAQMDMYKQEGVNPLGGCLPQLLQIGVLIVFFSAFNMVTAYTEGKNNIAEINNQLVPSFQIKPDFKFHPYFFGSDLRNTPNKEFGVEKGLNLLLPILMLVGSGALQYFSSKMMMPGPAKATDGKLAINESAYVKATPEKGDDMMEAMRTQSMYMMPLMTIFIGWNFSLGILLYWFVNSAVMLGQQIVVAKLDKKN